MKRGSVIWRGILTLFICLAVGTTPSYAETLQSNNYKFDEPTVGAGSLSQSNSTNYIGQAALGDIAVGNSSSAGFQINSGSKTSPDPVLSVTMTNLVADFGTFSVSSTSTTTAAFSIINYSSYGYAVQLTGDPPSHGGHVLAAMATTSSSHPGTEQFGINLVANTSPTNFGANLDNGQFGFGQVGNGPSALDYANYSTPNEFRYVPNETIASAPKSSGQTDYTISFIANVSSLTPGGTYTSNQTLIVTGTY